MSYPHPNPITPAEIARIEALKNPDRLQWVWNAIENHIRQGFGAFDNKGSVEVRLPGGYNVNDPESAPELFFPVMKPDEVMIERFRSQAIALGYRRADVKLSTVISNGFIDYWVVIELTFRMPRRDEL